MKEAYNIPLELLRIYIEYESSDEALAILFVKKYLKQSNEYWVDVIDFESYHNLSVDNLEFKSVLCGLYKRKLKPNYPSKNEFTNNGKFNDEEYYKAVRAITWHTANEDILRQKQTGAECVKYQIRGVKYNKNRGKFIKRPPWLDSPAWKDVDIYSLRDTDRRYVEQFLAVPDWRYEIKSILQVS